GANECLSVAESRQREERRTSNEPAGLFCLREQLVRLPCIETTWAGDRREHRRQIFPILRQRQKGFEIGLTKPRLVSHERTMAFGECSHDHLPESLHASRVWVRPTDDQTIEAARSEFGHAEPDPAAHRVTPEVGLLRPFCIARPAGTWISLCEFLSHK